MKTNKIAIGALSLVALLGCGSSGGGSASGGRGGAGGVAVGAGGTGATQAGGPGGAGGASICGGFMTFAGDSKGTTSWKDDGTLACPVVVISQRTTSSLADTYELDASSASTQAVDIALSSYNGLLNGTYTCQDGNGTTAPYVYLGVISPAVSGNAAPGDCTVNITFTTDGAGVEHARGTFSGTITTAAGTATITEGTFDITVGQTGTGAGGHAAGAGGQGGTTGSGAGGNGGMGGAADTQGLFL